MIAYSAFSARGTDIAERSEKFGERAGMAGLSGAAGAALMLATGTWLLAPEGGIGFRVMIAHSDAKRARYDALRSIVESLEADNAHRSGSNLLAMVRCKIASNNDPLRGGFRFQ